MPNLKPSDAEKAIAANAESRVQQGAQADLARNAGGSDTSGTKDAPLSTDLMGPGGDPVEGKR